MQIRIPNHVQPKVINLQVAAGKDNLRKLRESKEEWLIVSVRHVINYIHKTSKGLKIDSTQAR